MTRSSRAVARLSVGAVTILLAGAMLATFVPEAFAAALPVKAHVAAHGYSLHDFFVQASPVLVSLRATATDLGQRAAAKLAEVNDKLDADALRRIDEEHAELVRQLTSTRAQIAALEKPPAASLLDENAIRESVMADERARTSGILAQARSARIPADDAFVQNLLANGRPLAEARNDLMDEWSRRQSSRQDNPGGGEIPSGIEVQRDAVDRWAEGAERGLMIRTGLARAEDKDRGNEFVGLTLAELARSSLTVRNMKSGGENRMAMVGRAFTVRNSGPGFNSTSDFPSILQNVAYRAVLKGYQEVDETFPLWTGKGTASDFRPISRVDMGLFPSLGKVEEGAEYTYATMGDTGTVVQVATYGKLFAITRQAIINDDLQFFQRVPERMGRAAKRTIGNLVYAVLNGNPTMQDGVALFNAAHGNLATVAGAPNVANLAAAMAAMQVQTDTSGIGTGGGVMPKYVLTPPALWMPTKVAITSANYPGDPASVANPIRDMFTPISDSRLTGTAWYMAADPNQQDTIEVTYLDGVEEPFLDQKDGWTVDGTEMKVRIDAGVKALHWRGLYRNVGA
ncbi:hypothetical protein ABIE45_004544 [Methylobacterium sp. OAE515]|uniref:phage major capsid protein n=1 Tax=Methylobacterium sp. OAE515 TaxID=2817895 RepID=UPI00178B1441